MATEVVTRRLVEKRRRGFFGWIFLLIFWGFNALMLYSIVSTTGEMTHQRATYTDPTLVRAHDVGVGLGAMMFLIFWAAGAVVFGLLAHFTRGRRELVEIETRS